MSADCEPRAALLAPGSRTTTTGSRGSGRAARAPSAAPRLLTHIALCAPRTLHSHCRAWQPRIGRRNAACACGARAAGNELRRTGFARLRRFQAHKGRGLKVGGQGLGAEGLGGRSWGRTVGLLGCACSLATTTTHHHRPAPLTPPLRFRPPCTPTLDPQPSCGELAAVRATSLAATPASGAAAKAAACAEDGAGGCTERVPST